MAQKITDRLGRQLAAPERGSSITYYMVVRLLALGWRRKSAPE